MSHSYLDIRQPLHIIAGVELFRLWEEVIWSWNMMVDDQSTIHTSLQSADFMCLWVIGVCMYRVLVLCVAQRGNTAATWRAVLRNKQELTQMHRTWILMSLVCYALFAVVNWGSCPIKWANGITLWLIGWLSHKTNKAFFSMQLLGNYKMPRE